ncbi:hypothetical protein AMTR_s00098p00095890 [Amborella trichopoda]|uniref:Uncharacterized protein n=1 Tax=Amborella trichopoda TaxID=13333 RepID=W1NYS4_AMBTC|nr:hypothetical protein AMTR_s00098p00095890 [Amborella trichopoda]
MKALPCAPKSLRVSLNKVLRSLWFLSELMCQYWKDLITSRIFVHIMKKKASRRKTPKRSHVKPSEAKRLDHIIDRDQPFQ